MSKVKIKSDKGLNDQLKEQVQTLRGVINTGEPSSRFARKYCDDIPAVEIMDRETGKKTIVSLYAVASTMQALAELFE